MNPREVVPERVAVDLVNDHLKIVNTSDLLPVELALAPIPGRDTAVLAIFLYRSSGPAEICRYGAILPDEDPFAEALLCVRAIV